MVSSAARNGKVVEIIGGVLDVEFEPGAMPGILNALKIVRDTPDDRGRMEVVAEVQQHIGENMVRCISLSSTDGLRRGARCRRPGAGGPGRTAGPHQRLPQCLRPSARRPDRLLRGLDAGE